MFLNHIVDLMDSWTVGIAYFKSAVWWRMVLGSFFNKRIKVSYLKGIFIMTVEKQWMLMHFCPEVAFLPQSGIFAMSLQCSVAGIYFPLHSCCCVSCNETIAAEK